MKQRVFEVRLMKKVELIIEARNNEEQERKISAIAHIKYRLPCIGSYVVEVDAGRLPYLQNVEGVRAIHADSFVTSQLNK